MQPHDFLIIYLSWWLLLFFYWYWAVSFSLWWDFLTSFASRSDSLPRRMNLWTYLFLLVSFRALLPGAARSHALDISLCITALFVCHKAPFEALFPPCSGAGKLGYSGRAQPSIPLWWSFWSLFTLRHLKSSLREWLQPPCWPLPWLQLLIL